MRPRLVPAPKTDRQSDDEILRRTKEFYETLHPCCGNGAERRKLAAMAFCGCKRSGGEATDSDRSGKGGDEFYAQRAPKAWLEALAPLGTDSNKPFLEIAPWLIAVFAQPFRILTDGSRSPTYYAIESVGIATGILVAAVHSCGLVSLTHTPSPMGFLNRILGRPSYEKPFVLLVVGHPAENALVPDIGRKAVEKISSFVTAGDSKRLTDD